MKETSLIQYYTSRPIINIPFMMTMYTSTLRMPINSSNHGNAIIGATHTGVFAVFTVILLLLFIWFGKSTGPGTVVIELYKH